MWKRSCAISRSRCLRIEIILLLLSRPSPRGCTARMVELVDTPDLKSCGQQWPCRFDPGFEYKHRANMLKNGSANTCRAVFVPVGHRIRNISETKRSPETFPLPPIPAIDKRRNPQPAGLTDSALCRHMGYGTALYPYMLLSIAARRSPPLSSCSSMTGA